MALPLYWIVVATTVIQTALAVVCILCMFYRTRKPTKRVCIVVLGDVGRSPRMQYHAQSFARESFTVDVVGFGGSQPIPGLVENKHVDFWLMRNLVPQLSFMPGILRYFLKTLIQSVQLLFVLMFCIQKPNSFLVQNPPSIPTLAVTWLVCCIKGCDFVIDWHNYAFTILALNVKSSNHPLVKFSRFFEGFFGKLADKNICVTKAMKSDLEIKWNVQAEVLYDRPADLFREISVDERHNLMMSLSKELPEIAIEGAQSEETLFTIKSEGVSEMKSDRPALLVTSTSWTEDEDFSVLLSALESYDEMKQEDSSDSTDRRLPNILCCITGKGPLKEYYKNEIRKKSLKHVQFLTPWLSAEDYPRLIASADLGVCLHTSSSGVDLPMKVVDMYGCCLPACAIHFSCLDELVHHGKNGLIFKTVDELLNQIVECFRGFPIQQDRLIEFRQFLRKQKSERGSWHDNWSKVVLPLFNSC